MLGGRTQLCTLVHPCSAWQGTLTSWAGPRERWRPAEEPSSAGTWTLLLEAAKSSTSAGRAEEPGLCHNCAVRAVVVVGHGLGFVREALDVMGLGLPGASPRGHLAQFPIQGPVDSCCFAKPAAI